MEITVRRIEREYKAWFTASPQNIGYGNTRAAAIGNLIIETSSLTTVGNREEVEIYRFEEN